MTDVSSTCYAAFVPHPPTLAVEQRDWNAQLWEAYDARVAEFKAFDPELVFVFGGDHYSSIHLNLAPTFMIGQIARAIYDCGGMSGDLDVPQQLALDCAATLTAEGFDIATSYAMEVDHGFSSVLRYFFEEKLTARPVIPIHINSLTYPRPTLKRCRQLGEAIGRFAKQLDKRVALLGSGGLSHETNFLFPQYVEAPSEDVREYIVNGGRRGGPIGHDQWMEDQAQKMYHVATEIHEGRLKLAVNKEWDMRFLGLFLKGDLSKLDEWRDEDILKEAGQGGGEIRAWIAGGAAALAASDAPGSFILDYYSDTTEIGLGAAIAHAHSVNV